MKFTMDKTIKTGIGLGIGFCIGKGVYNVTADFVSVFTLKALHRLVEADLIKDERIIDIVNEYYKKAYPEETNND